MSRRTDLRNQANAFGTWFCLTQQPIACMSKAEDTFAAIVKESLNMAVETGLEVLSLGAIADRVRLSKSGVFSRVGSVDCLQQAVLEHYRRTFERAVLQPALLAPMGLLRVQSLFTGCLEHVANSGNAGCFYFSCAGEYDRRPGPIRDALTKAIRSWRLTLGTSLRQAIILGHLQDKTDPEQVAFEIYALLLGVQHDLHMLDIACSVSRAMAAFTSILQRWCPAKMPAVPSTVPVTDKVISSPLPGLAPERRTA